MRLIKKKKGSKEYYYLQHSFRKGGIVKTREKYVGEIIPSNIDQIKKDFQFEFKEELYGKLEKIKENFTNEWKRIPDSMKEKELREIAIAFTYNSNAIEGSTITLEEVREIIEDSISPNKPIRDVKETEAHVKVFLEMLRKKQKITKSVLLKWHKDIFNETKQTIAGKYRDYLVRVGPYLAPDWQDVEKLMNNFLKKIEKLEGNPVEISARTHYKFEKIHPFGDGNGRIGRLISNYILWKANYPMLIIEYKKRGSYYKALTKDEEGFVNYYLKRYLAVHGKRLIDKKY